MKTLTAITIDLSYNKPGYYDDCEISSVIALFKTFDYTKVFLHVDFSLMSYLPLLVDLNTRTISDCKDPELLSEYKRFANHVYKLFIECEMFDHDDAYISLLLIYSCMNKFARDMYYGTYFINIDLSNKIETEHDMLSVLFDKCFLYWKNYMLRKEFRNVSLSLARNTALGKDLNRYIMKITKNLVLKDLDICRNKYNLVFDLALDLKKHSDIVLNIESNDKIVQMVVSRPCTFKDIRVMCLDNDAFGHLKFDHFLYEDNVILSEDITLSEMGIVQSDDFYIK